MSTGGLGKIYEDGEAIVRQGEVGDCMFVIQEGRARVLLEKDGKEKSLRVAGEGELIGEMAVFEKQVRSATVRALGRVRVLTIDKKNFLRRIAEDPSIAFRVVQTMSRRVRELSDEVARLKSESAAGEE
jgi:CRP-like cAMP-binding protein